MMSWPAESISKRSGRSAKAGSVQIWSHLLVARVSARLVTGWSVETPGRDEK
jgi:hypothetical protein